MKRARHIALAAASVFAAFAVGATAQTNLINEDFQTPDVPDNTADPAFPGWTWIGGVKGQDSPGDGVPGSGNQVIQFEWTGRIARYDTTHGWSAGETYVLTLNASPQSWGGTTRREIVAGLYETNGVQLWTSGSVWLPLYDNYAGNPWGTRQTFSFVVYSDDFSAGTPGTDLRLELTSTGSRGLFFDNVSLDVTNLAADVTAPTPNPLTWIDVPAITNNTNIYMKCTFASDDFPYGVQHYFENTNTGVNSGWQDGVEGWTWTEYGLAPGSTNSYRCKARDKSPSSNETAWSSVQTVIMPSPDTTPPNPDPMTFALEPMVVDSINIYMEATTAVDAEFGVEYLFENVNTGSNSGWQASSIWSELGQEQGVALAYRVKARDVSPQSNETAWATNTYVTIPAQQGLLVDAVFQLPSYPHNTVDPFFPGWSFSENNMKIISAANASDVPGDWPAETNKVLYYEQNSPVVTYDLSHSWGEDYIYTLTLNASPVAWSGQNQRYLDASVREVSGDTVLWSTNITLPLYTNDFDRAPWPPELTFSNQMTGVDFLGAGGTEGEPIYLRLFTTGQRGMYVDNVRLTGIVPPPSGTVLLIK